MNNNLSETQKGLAVIFSSFIMNESPSSNTLLAILNLTVMSKFFKRL